jgi:hypothetical protein
MIPSLTVTLLPRPRAWGTFPAIFQEKPKGVRPLPRKKLPAASSTIRGWGRGELFRETVTVLATPRAIPNASNPGPRLAVVPGIATLMVEGDEGDFIGRKKCLQFSADQESLISSFIHPAVREGGSTAATGLWQEASDHGVAECSIPVAHVHILPDQPFAAVGMCFLNRLRCLLALRK